MENEIEMLKAEELEDIKGAFGLSVDVYGLNVQGVSNCCNTTSSGSTSQIPRDKGDANNSVH